MRSRSSTTRRSVRSSGNPVPPEYLEPEPATVPIVLGLRVERVARLLERAGLVVGSVTTVPGRAGIVVRTDPTQGEAVAAGTEVDLFVGSGPDT